MNFKWKFLFRLKLKLYMSFVPACPDGFFGPYCKYKCDCVNEASCDPVNGQCVCRPGFMGERCEQGEMLHMNYSQYQEIFALINC